MSFEQLVATVPSVIGFLAVFIMNQVRKSIDETKQSVDLLNLKVATVIEKTSNHEKQLDGHSDRIMNLEKRGKA